MTNAGQPAGGVRVRLEGSKATSTTTDQNGYYAFGDLRAGGNYAVTPVGAQINFTPLSRSFFRLAQDGSADFVGLGERAVRPVAESKPVGESKPLGDSQPASQCTDADQSRERKNIIWKYRAAWQENIKGERRRENSEATLGPIESQISFSEECKVASVTLRYTWRISSSFNGEPAKVVNLPKQRRFLCVKTPVGWFCKSI